MRVSPASGGRCRPPPGKTFMIGSACTPARMRVQFRDGARLGAQATRQSDAPARERRPLVGTARRRRAAGKDPEFGVVRLSAGTSAFSVIRAAARYTPFAALRAAVPTRGRRSLASGAIWTVGGPARGCICAATGRRSAFPCLRRRPEGDRWPELHFSCGGLSAELTRQDPAAPGASVAAVAVGCMRLLANV